MYFYFLTLWYMCHAIQEKDFFSIITFDFTITSEQLLIDYYKQMFSFYSNPLTNRYLLLYKDFVIFFFSSYFFYFCILFIMTNELIFYNSVCPFFHPTKFPLFPFLFLKTFCFPVYFAHYFKEIRNF